VRVLARRFVDCCEMFEHHFIVRGHDVADHARHYLSGLLGKERRKNIERIEADVAESNYEGMQHFIADSPWDHTAVMHQVAEQAESTLGGAADTGLYVDESSFVKKGNASVGVQRQYCGRLGKLENCQVGVFAALGRGNRAALVDFRLFLPESWAADAKRCAKAKIPQAQRVHRTKTELALEMVVAARARGSTHRWVGGDEVYGNNHVFTAALEDLGETFLMDVASNLKVWTSDPGPKVPSPRRGRTGRPRSRAQAAASASEAVAVKALVAANFAAQAREVSIRDATKGPLRARVWVRQVWVWDGESCGARRRLLLVREEGDGTFKYSLSNAAPDTPWERLAYMQAQRFWIERCFEDAKSELGMAQYEVRGWSGWHHHMALVSLALLFVLQERCRAKKHTPLLSARDIVELLAIYLPRRPRDEAEVLRQMQQRHAARRRDLQNRRRRLRRTENTRAKT
jgi:SRSO17 transposase